jgi:hypothetical protein
MRIMWPMMADYRSARDGARHGEHAADAVAASVMRPFGASKAAFWIVRACRVDIEIDRLHASLPSGVAGAGVPGPIPELSVADPGEPKAFPLASRRKAAVASPGELVGQRDLLPVGMAENDRAELARVPTVGAKNLFPAAHRLFEQIIGGARHRVARHQH